jgi:hypothetical protein
MNFSAWSIRNPVAPILAFVLLCLMGWQSFNALPITQMPAIDVPLVSVAVGQPGAAPAELESQVTRIVEDAVAGISGVDDIQSSISDGFSSTIVAFDMDVETDQAVQDVKDQIDQIVGDLPPDVETPTVTRINVEGGAILTYAVAAPALTFEELSWFVDNELTSRLQGLSGVGRVDRYGGADREIRVELDPVRLDAYGITAATVSQQLTQVNSNQGAGRLELGSGEQAIRVLGDQGDAERLAATTIALPSGQQVRLGDLGTVVDTYEELRSFTKVDGQTVVTFAIFRAKGRLGGQRGPRSVRAGWTRSGRRTGRVHRPRGRRGLLHLRQLQGGHPHADRGRDPRRARGAAVPAELARDADLGGGAALVGHPDLLGDGPPGLLAQPRVVPGPHARTGISVDDAIVEIENIQRHIRMGKTPYRAAIDAADEIGLAVIATTFTIVAVFVPVSFMPGVPGQYFRQFGLTVAIAVLFSLLVARLITPLMAAYLMRTKDAGTHEQRDGWIMRGYLWFVRVTATGRLLFIPARYLTLLTAFGVLAVSIYFMLQVPGSLFPEEDQSRFQIAVELPPGSTLEQTEEATDAITAAIREVEGVERVMVTGGASPTGGLDVRRATVTVILERLDNTLERKLLDIVEAIPVVADWVPDVPYHGRSGLDRPQSEIESEVTALLAPIPDVRAFTVISGPGGAGARDITYSILSDDPIALDEAVRRLEEALRGDPLLSGVSAEGALPRPELRITPRAEEAARLGVTTAAIAQTVRVATIGDFDAALAKVSVDNRLIPVRVELSESVREGPRPDRGAAGADGRGRLGPPHAVADIRIARAHRPSRAQPRAAGQHRGEPAPGRGAGRARRASTRSGPSVELARGRPGGGIGRRRGPGRSSALLRQRHGAGPPARAHGADPAVQVGDPALHHPVLSPPRHRGRGGGADPDAEPGLHAGDDRHPDADGDRHQERDPPRRLRGRDARPRDVALPGHRRSGAQAGAPHRDDLDRHVGGDASLRAGRRRGRVVPRAHGHRGDRRHHRLDGPVARDRAVLLPHHGRHAAGAVLDLRPLRGGQGRGVRGARRPRARGRDRRAARGDRGHRGAAHADRGREGPAGPARRGVSDGHG